ncbi:hypothetical protein GMDG_08604 [Pseudogymnoascus destructans 20631-21]|uniref:Uncharacterized protein n=2 Tax=Pseudogymnoascus destructans TaxID=655981 RepID=L8G636_PSED2|nr:hypothetical protein GMDG_08604 [Pseudogymnoascus destructans 20631-21]
MAWFLADEYQAIVDAETSTNPDPAAAKAAAAEAVRVANLTAANMPKFRSPAEASAYMESMALRNAVEDGLRRVRQAVTAVGRDTAALLEGQGSLLEGLESSLKGVGKSVVAAVDKVSVAVAAGPRGQKRKRGEEDGDEAAEGTFSAPIG